MALFHRDQYHSDHQLAQICPLLSIRNVEAACSPEQRVAEENDVEQFVYHDHSTLLQRF